MLHRDAKVGDRIILTRGEERLYVFVRDMSHGKVTLSLSAPRDWRIEHLHAEKLGNSDLTGNPQPG